MSDIVVVLSIFMVGGLSLHPRLALPGPNCPPLADLHLPYTGCISSYSGKENAKDNVIEITNLIRTFIVLDIVIVI